jgi:cyclic pyranopterin phosphate synthase
MSKEETKFTHLDEKNNPCMVNVSDKIETARTAKASCEVLLPGIVWKNFKDGDFKTPKGSVIHTAIIAGTMGVKKTSDLIPFCHQLNIEGCKIDIQAVGKALQIECVVKCFGKTGVEMEALMGAQMAAITIYDMCKVFSKEIVINNLKLIEKNGGKSDYGNH